MISRKKGEEIFSPLHIYLKYVFKKAGVLSPAQTVEKAVRPQGIKDKETNIKNSHAGNKHKAFIENALRFLAFFVFALWRTPVRRRMQKRKIYLPFSTSASVSRLSRHADPLGKSRGDILKMVFNYFAEPF